MPYLQANKKSNGKLFPRGALRLLKAVKSQHEVIDFYFIAVAPEH